MSRGRAIALRFIVIALVIVALFWGSLCAYTEYEAIRANSVLAEVSRVQIGEPEGAVLGLTNRYGGAKWTPEPLPPREQWIDRDEYDYQLNRQSDYKYELGVSPLWATVAGAGRLTQLLRSAREALPEHLRPLLGLRDWGTVVEVSIRGGRVQSVSAMTLFEGRSEWLGHSWELAEEMPRHDMPRRAYAIGAAHLTMANGGGEVIQCYLTTKASEEEVEAARSFNPRCLTSLSGCDGLCDVAPHALEYLQQHPDASWNIIPPRCH